MKKQKLKTEAHLKASASEIGEQEATRFYLQPELQLVHAFLGVEDFIADQDLIARSLRIDSIKLNALIQELQTLGFIKKTDKGYQKIKKLKTTVSLRKFTIQQGPSIMSKTRKKKHPNQAHNQTNQ